MSNFFSRLWNRKQSRALTVVTTQEADQSRSTPKNYDAMSHQGYLLNVICYDATQKIAKGLGSLKWNLFQKNIRGKRGDELEGHPILDLLSRPNPMMSKFQFMQAVASFYQIAGNVFIEGISGTGRKYRELYPLPPTYFKIIPGTRGFPKKYVFKYRSEEINYEVDEMTGLADILHLKTFHPTNMYWGMSPLEPAFLSIDQHNAAAKHNLGLLQNGARPSGAVKIDKDFNGTGVLDDDEFDNLKEQLRDTMQGPQNAGKTVILEGGMEWTQMAMNLADLDWLEGTNQNARNISLALGVPPILLNIPGDSTYNNYAEARQAMYEETVIPLAYMLRDELNRWLVPGYGDRLELDIDIDSIESLNPKRQNKFEMYQQVDYLTDNEKRSAVGYDPIEGGDTLARSASVSDLSETEEERSDSENEDQSEDEKSVKVIEKETIVHEDLLAGDLKVFNLITRDEKKKTRRKMEALETFYIKRLEEDLADDYFKPIAKSLRKINTTEKRLAEAQALKAIDKMDEELSTLLQKYLKRVARQFGDPIIDGGKSWWGANWEQKKESDYTSWIEFFVAQRAQESLQVIKSTTLSETRSILEKEIFTGVSEGQSIDTISSNISKRFSDISTSRARTIARTEVGISSKQATLQAAEALDIPDLRKEWIATDDHRTRDDHNDMDGTKVGLKESFSVNGSIMNGPGDPSGPADQVINCRCRLVFEV